MLEAVDRFDDVRMGQAQADAGFVAQPLVVVAIVDERSLEHHGTPIRRTSQTNAAHAANAKLFNDGVAPDVHSPAPGKGAVRLRHQPKQLTQRNDR